MRPKPFLLAALLAASVAGPPAARAQQGEVNIYSNRQEYLIRPLLDRFEQKTGIGTNVVYASDGILERLKAEGRNSPADAVLTVDISRLVAHQKAGQFKPVRSPVLDANIPAVFRHPQGLWYGLTTRARVVVYAKDRVDPAAVQTYEDLARSDLNHGVCTRSGTHPYNISLLSFMIAVHGEEEARAWAEGLKANLARRPQGGDRDQVRAVASGECDVAVVNSYYIGQMLADPKEKAVTDAVAVVFPNQRTTGTHVNVSGVGVTANAPHAAEALRLIEFLSSEEAQTLYAEDNFEYPVHPGVKPTPIVESWGAFKKADINLAEIAAHADRAARVFNEIDYDG